MPYKTINGRRRQRVPSCTNGVQHLVSLVGTVATFECKAGHKMRKDYSKGPVSKRVTEPWLLKMAAYWGLGLQSNGTRGHVYGWCQKCQNIADGVTDGRPEQVQSA